MDFPGQGLQLDSEQREHLGLDADESVRVVQRSGRLIVLERVGDEGATPVPWDRELIMTADVRAFPMADVLNLIHEAGKSGFLLLVQGEHEKSVYFHRGEVVFASSNQRVDRIGECLLRSGAITLEQLREADARWTPNMRFGKVLVQLGVLTPRDLWNAVKTQVEDVVRSLFAYTWGTVHIWEGEIQPDNVVRLALPTNRLIEEGLARRDELFKLLAHLEDERTRLTAVPGMEARVSSSEAAFLDALGRDGVFSAGCRRAGVDPLSGARTVQLLQLVGAVRVDREPDVESGPADRDARRQADDRVRECVYDHAKLLAELAAPIVAVDGPEAFGERFARIVEETGERHAILAGVSPAPGGMLDPDLLIAAALRMAGDRVRAAQDALGELVTYLEFELNNHPRVQGAATFLEAVEELRAKIEA